MITGPYPDEVMASDLPIPAEMPSRQRYLEAQIGKYLNKKTKRGRLSMENGERYRKHILRISNVLADAGLQYTPKKIGEAEIDHLLDIWKKDKLDVDTQKWYISMLNGYLKHYRNEVIRKMEIGWPAETRVRIDWLTPQEAVRMLRAAQGVERIIIHMELRLWLRRIEVQRLTPEDIKENIIDVHGKGRFGGKWRTLAWASETFAEVAAYEELRESMIEAARAINPNVTVPKQWIIYRKGKRLGAYGKTAIDNIVQRVAKRAGIDRKIGNHTLRRTGCRLAYHAKVDIELIREAMGHKDIKTTYRYMGITVDELAHGQEKVSDYLRSIEQEMDGSPVIMSSRSPQKAANTLRISS